MPAVSAPPLAVPDIVPPALPSVSVPGVSLPTPPSLPPLPVPAVAISLSLGVSVPSLAAAAPARISVPPVGEVGGEIEVSIPTVPGRLVPTLPAIPTLPVLPTLPVPAAAVSLSLGVSVPSLAAAAPARISLSPVGEVAGELEVAIPTAPGIPALPDIPAALATAAIHSLPLQQASIAPLSLPTLPGLPVPSLGLPDIALPTLPAGFPGVSAPSLSLPLDISNPTLPTLPALPITLPTGLPPVSGVGLPSLTLPVVQGASGLEVLVVSSGRPDGGVSSLTTGLPQLSVQTGLPRASVTGLAAAATLSPPTGRLQASAAGAQAPLTDSLEAGAVLATGRSQASAPGLPQTLRSGEVVLPAGQSLAGILRPTTLPQNLPGSGQLSIAGEAVQPTQAPPGPSQLPPPTSLPRASLAGALHATAPDPPRGVHRTTTAVQGDCIPTCHLRPSAPRCPVAPRTVPALHGTATVLHRAEPTLQPGPSATPPHAGRQCPPRPVYPRLRGWSRAYCHPRPHSPPVPNAVSVQVVTTDGPLHDDPPRPSSDDGNDPPPLQGDNINDIDNDPSNAPADNVKDGPFAPLVVPGGNVDDTNDAASSLLPSAPNTTLVPTGAAAVYASSSPPLLLSCFAHPATPCFLFSFSLVVWGSVGIVL